jgi:hypothetical protein
MRAIAFGAVVCLFAIGCSDTSPLAPSSTTASRSLRPMESGWGPQPGFGTADLAVCLSGSREPSCFSGARYYAHTTLAATAAAIEAPGGPANLSAVVTGDSVTLAWSAPTSGDPVLSYVLEAGSASGASNLATLVTSTATMFSATGIGAGTYFVRIRAQNSAGLSVASNEIVVVVGSQGCATAPNTPVGLGGTLVGASLTLVWNPPVGGCAPTSYVLLAGSASGLSDIASFNTGSVATTFQASGVGSGPYFLRVVAANGNGQSAPSNEIVVPAGPPAGALLSESFEGALDPRISVQVTGTFSTAPSARSAANFGSSRAFGFGLAGCGANCFFSFVSTLRIAFPSPQSVGRIEFKEMELLSNWGSGGGVFVDGQPLTPNTSPPNFNAYNDFGRLPYNDLRPDTTFRSRSFPVGRMVTSIELRVADITNRSEIYVDDLVITRP